MSEEISIRLGGRLGTFTLDVDFRLPMNGISALFGPSGCGKTTILRAVAGLHHIEGRIAIGDRVLQDRHVFIPVHQRRLGYVFQEPSLFPHLSVRRNLTYGLRRARSDPPHVRFDDIVDLLRIAQLVDRSPEHLSGGERQRVSIGRALLSQPSILLMDEPLSALDQMAKEEILPYLEALHASLRIPILLVTHDLAEVERLADHLVLLQAGRLKIAGPLNDVLLDPLAGLSSRRDHAAILGARVIRVDPDGIAVIDIDGCRLFILADGLKPGESIRVRIAATDVSIARARHEQSSILNAVPAKVLGIEPIGNAEAAVKLDLGVTAMAPIRARITRRSLEGLHLRKDSNVIAQIKSVSLVTNR